MMPPARWFEYPVVVHPHQTDYAGIVWHGTYVAWMEEARIECLKSVGYDFAELIESGCDLQVVELTLRYHLPLRLGAAAVVKTFMAPVHGVRYDWHYQICDLATPRLCVTGTATLVPVERDRGKIMRRVPGIVQTCLERIVDEFYAAAQ